jgi:hypothetical protein
VKRIRLDVTEDPTHRTAPRTVSGVIGCAERETAIAAMSVVSSITHQLDLRCPW